MKLLLRVLFILFITGCTLHEGSKVVHPTPENISIGGKGSIINASDLHVKQNTPKSKKILSAFKSKQNLATIGTLYGDQKEMFGSIRDVSIDSFHRIYTLDSDKQLISVFSQKGVYITSLGGKGSGPGEFEFAKSMANYNDSLLLVGNGYRIEVFDIEHKEITFLKTLALERWAHSLCVSGDKLFVHNNKLWQKEGKIDGVIGDKMKKGDNIPMIQAYSIPSFELLFSFGQSYKSTNPMVIDRLTSGSLSCSTASSTIVFTFNKIPVIHGYSTKDGRLKWKSRMDGLHFTSIVQTNEGGRTRLTYKTDKIMMDWIAPPISLDRHYDLLQVRRKIFTEGYDSKTKILTFLLNISAGEGSFLSEDIPEIIAISDNLIATISDDFLVSHLYKY